LEEFSGYKTIDEGRPKLVKFKLKKNNKKWTMTDVEAKKHFFVQIDDEDANKNIHSFLTSIKAYDEYTLPRTNGEHAIKGLEDNVSKTGETVFWLPMNRIDKIKSTWKFQPPKPVNELSAADTLSKMKLKKKITDLMTDRDKISLEIAEIKEQILGLSEGLMTFKECIKKVPQEPKQK